MYLFKNHEKVFCPEYSNTLLVLLPNADTDGEVDDTYPFKISELDTYTKDGKRLASAKNPSVFPESMYESLKAVYPDLSNEPPLDTTYAEAYNILLSILPGVLCGVSDISVENALDSSIRIRDNNNCWAYYVPINPYSLKPCKTVEEYLNTVGDS